MDAQEVAKQRMEFSWRKRERAHVKAQRWEKCGVLQEIKDVDVTDAQGKGQATRMKLTNR